MRRVRDDNSLHCVQIGTDFSYHNTFNALLEVEWMGGDSDMTEEEYYEQHYRHDQSCLETGGRYFRVRLEVPVIDVDQLVCGCIWMVRVS